ncbi:TetR/AcrR family transcriptional regulator [Luteipulveratus flavus]|uniref:TetR/AcrR family transcriptional regulator n=1 Tax=Luteipulveratus flavus TaxID=3031728 RepID=A0ABT6CCK7_9MICO|nr:TetR/AcrR family transcriptional regulator [Luteipulveratus sp. YIM 133296]MDF8266511.1 TetR/AcrR family transcriptional regulator [Luteipulveratus sp. YIM 133296]
MTTSARARMTGKQRREQLITVGRRVFAERGVGAATVEEIASEAGVTKPLIYEHFGGKEGLYAVVVDREMARLLGVIADALDDTDAAPRYLLEQATLAMLDYIEDSPDGFRVLAHDSPSWHTGGSLGSLMSDIAVHIEQALAATFTKNKLDTRTAPVYAQMLLGAIALTGEWWLESGRRIKKAELAAHMVNLTWNGLTGLEQQPRLTQR